MHSMLEICVDGTASARAAALGGADRVELCANLPEGGTTPSTGMIRAVRSLFGGALIVLIRPRAYDFLYSEDDFDVMLQDVAMARNLGADGVAIGCLTADGRVDSDRCGQLRDAAGKLDTTFHRAFDMSCDLAQSLEDIVALGIRRVLTSGGCASALLGLDTIAHLARRSAGRVALMAGGGVTPDNVSEILSRTGVREIHLSARSPVRSAMTFRNEECSMGAFSSHHEYEWRETNAAQVRRVREIMAAATAAP